jgi:hypothetical protein
MPFRRFPVLLPVLLAVFALVACDKDDVTSAGGIGNARIAPRAEAISAYPALQPAGASAYAAREQLRQLQ